MKYRRIYLAYGSNINLEQMARRCPTAKVLESKMLQGHELEFRGVATIVPKKGAEVPVLIWEIGERDEINLDRYEGFPSFYRKEIFEMEVGGKMRECMAYVMNRGEIDPPSQQYYRTILNGYRANGMDERYLERALMQSLTEQEERIRQEQLDEEEDFVMGLE